MATIIQNYLKNEIVSFAFKEIETYTNARGEIKKKPIGMPNWRTINKKNCLAFDNGKAFGILTGEISNLTIFDFDVREEYEKMVALHPDLKQYKTIQTNKGYHIWFKYDNTYKTSVDCLETFKGVDIRNDAGVVFCPPTRYILPNGEEVEYKDLGGSIDAPPTYLKNYLKKWADPPTRGSGNGLRPLNPRCGVELHSENELITTLLHHNLLDGKAFGSWDDWKKVALCMRYTTTYEHFEKFSKINKEKYDEKATYDMWYSIHENYEGANVATLFKYAKEYNPEKYNLYFNFFIPLEKLQKGAFCVAEHIYFKLERHLKWSNHMWYMWNKKTNLWVETKEPSHIIVQNIHKHIDYSIQIKTAERGRSEDDEKQKQITEDIQTYAKMYRIVDGNGFYSMMTKHLKTILCDDLFYKKLDTNKYQLAFKDGIYHFRENVFIKGYSEYDYITKTIPFDYVEPNDDQVKFVKEVIFKICNCKEEHLNYYLGVLGQALLGDAELEKALYFCVGVGGNNGKTLILEALAEIMPNYVGKIERKTFEKGYAKAHKHLVGTKAKRIVYVEELSTKEQEIEILKEIGDGKSIKNEVMYGTDEQIDIMFKLIFLSNTQANLKTDGGIANRYRELTHNSKFNRDTTEDDYDRLNFIQDNTLADKLKGEYRHALLHLLMMAGHAYTKTKKLVIPSEFQEAINDTLEANDWVLMWFNERCEYGEDFKSSKKKLEEAIGRPFKDFQGDIQRITNKKYDRNLRFGKEDEGRGGWKGFRIKSECLVV